MFLLGTIAVSASIWALVRHYTYVNPPMIVPVDAGELEIPVETVDDD